MAGQGETCSHIGALLYWVEYTVRRRDETSHTSLTNSCMEPSAVSTVPYLQIQDIDFTSSERKRKTKGTTTSQQVQASAKSGAPIACTDVSKSLECRLKKLFDSCIGSETLPYCCL